MKSTYSPTKHNEQERLKKQSKIREEDSKSFVEGIKLFKNKKDLIALDIGCAEGFVTKERFLSNNKFKTIIGIDKDKKAIKTANSKNYNNMIFFNIDIETKQGFKKLKQKLKEKNIKGIDLIYSSYVFHHLRKPTKILKKLKKLLNKKGVIIIQTVEDYLSFAYPDKNKSLKKILKISEKIPGMSNRRHGRKIYYQIKKSKLEPKGIYVNNIDFLNKTKKEKKRMFKNIFEWRLNYIKAAKEKQLIKIKKLNKLEKKLKYHLKELKKEFIKKNFYLMKPSITLITQKTL